MLRNMDAGAVIAPIADAMASVGMGLICWPFVYFRCTIEAARFSRVFFSWQRYAS
jgi:hypothetical protein